MAYQQTTPSVTIRPALTSDLPQINSVTTHYILNTVITFALEPTPSAQLLSQFIDITENQKLPWLVAVSCPTPSSPSAATSNIPKNSHKTSNEEQVLGYACAKGFRGSKGGYAHTVEITIALHPDHVRKSIGKVLLSALINALRLVGKRDNDIKLVTEDRKEPTGVEEVIAVMAVDVTAKDEGMALKRWYEQAGFVDCGGLKKVGRKFGRW